MNQSSTKISESSVDQVCDLLEQTYGSPGHGNPTDPLDDLIYITLSNKTSPQTAMKLYSHLKRSYLTWDDLCDEKESVLAEQLKPGGFGTIKSQFILNTLRRVKGDRGNCELTFLRNQTEAQVLEFLMSLPGVSNKVARCVMMYTLGFEVLPVDAHVYRIAKRLGWATKNRPDLSHLELEKIIPKKLRYGFHVNAIAHGRIVCRASQPRCQSCCIRKYCAFAKSK